MVFLVKHFRITKMVAIGKLENLMQLIPHVIRAVAVELAGSQNGVAKFGDGSMAGLCQGFCFSGRLVDILHENDF